MQAKEQESGQTKNSLSLLKAELQTEATRFQCEKSELQSALDAQAKMAVGANQTISDLESALEATRKEAETLKARYDSEVTHLQLVNSGLHLALGALKGEVADSKQKLSQGVADFKRWMQDSSIHLNTALPVPDLSKESSGDAHHVLAHNVLLKVRSKDWSSAYEDANQSINIRPSAMGFIGRALAQIGMGEGEQAIQAFDLAFKNCDPDESNLMLLIKAVIFSVAGKYGESTSRVEDLLAATKDDESMYSYIQVLGKMYLMQRDYASALQLLERGQSLASSCAGHDLETISLIFGWTFDSLQMTVQRLHCEDLCAAGRVDEAAEVLLKLLDTFDKEIRASKVTPEWVTDLKKKCVDMLVAFGDTASSSGEFSDAIVRYTSALSLNAPNPIDILAKRSKARASKGLWQDALTDANEVIKLDPSSYRGYERKYVALRGTEDHGEANNVLLHLLSIIENSPDPAVRRLRENYTNPRETIAAIDAAIHEVFSLCPLVLIDVNTGRLCDTRERVQMFKSEIPFKRLVSETATSKVDHAHIRQVVAQYFKWSMFSHTWEGKEPTFQDVNLVDSILNLDKSPLNEKLCQFCATAREHGYRWAWSDTCCIDKTTSAILSQSLTSMYSWYEEAAETLVYLADVLSSAELGDLTKSRWMTRAWTLQELLASKVIRFYNREWKLYLNDGHSNHKESPAIKQELAEAMGVGSETIRSFRPADLGVREKLRLASTRNATVEEDVAYSLIGIFSSDIAPRYGLGKAALGQLLENIVARTGDVTVIAWTGAPLPYNSALPASLAVYNRAPYSPPPMEASELDTRAGQLRTRLSPEDVLAFYYQVTQLPRATFSNRCLQLPCLVFPVTKIGVQELGGGRQGTLYRSTVSLLGKVEFRSVDAMPLTKPRKLAFVCPWLRELTGGLDGFVSDEESDAESDGGSEVSGAASGVDTDNSKDASVPASPLHAEPSAQVDRYTLALRLIARLDRPFNALLLEQQPNRQYKRVAADHEIVVPGVSYQTLNPKDIKVKTLEIV